MVKGCIHSATDLILLVPGRIGIPGYHIDMILQVVIIYLLGRPHHIGGHRNVRSCRTNGLDLHFHKVRGLVCNEISPIQIETRHNFIRLPVLHRRVDLLPIGNCVAPKCAPPGMIQRIQAVVIFLFQPIAKGCLA